MKTFVMGICFALGAMWGHYGTISFVLPSHGYAWSDGYGSDGCGMCPWHDEPEETRDRERKEQEEKDSGHCGAEGKPTSDEDSAGVHNGIAHIN